MLSPGIVELWVPLAFSPVRLLPLLATVTLPESIMRQAVSFSNSSRRVTIHKGGVRGKARGDAREQGTLRTPLPTRHWHPIFHHLDSATPPPQLLAVVFTDALRQIAEMNPVDVTAAANAVGWTLRCINAGLRTRYTKSLENQRERTNPKRPLDWVASPCQYFRLFPRSR